MDRQEIIARLRENEATLHARGVRHAALFGRVRVARNAPIATSIS